MIIAILGSLLLWPVYLALFVVLALMGLVIIPIMVLLRRYYFDGDNCRWLDWQWMAPWDNLEHGIAGFAGYKPEVSLMWRIFNWSALRNPVNGLRFIFGIKVNASRIRYRGNSTDPEASAMQVSDKTYWAFTWQGPLAGFKLARSRNRRMTEVWIGWKFLPRDRTGPRDWRSNNVGFAIQPFVRWNF